MKKPMTEAQARRAARRDRDRYNQNYQAVPKPDGEPGEWYVVLYPPELAFDMAHYLATGERRPFEEEDESKEIEP